MGVHPETQVAANVFGFVYDKTDFSEPGFFGVFAEVVVERVFKSVAFLVEHPDEGCELFFAPRIRKRGIGMKEFSQLLGDFEHEDSVSHPTKSLACP